MDPQYKPVPEAAVVPLAQAGSVQGLICVFWWQLFWGNPSTFGEPPCLQRAPPPGWADRHANLIQMLVSGMWNRGVWRSLALTVIKWNKEIKKKTHVGLEKVTAVENRTFTKKKKKHLQRMTEVVISRNSERCFDREETRRWATEGQRLVPEHLLWNAHLHSVPVQSDALGLVSSKRRSPLDLWCTDLSVLKWLHTDCRFQKSGLKVFFNRRALQRDLLLTKCNGSDDAFRCIPLRPQMSKFCLWTLVYIWPIWCIFEVKKEKLSNWPQGEIIQFFSFLLSVYFYFISLFPINNTLIKCFFLFALYCCFNHAVFPIKALINAFYPIQFSMYLVWVWQLLYDSAFWVNN